MNIRLKILFHVVKWAFRGWKLNVDVHANDKTEEVSSITITAVYPENIESMTEEVEC